MSRRPIRRGVLGRSRAPRPSASRTNISSIWLLSSQSRRRPVPKSQRVSDEEAMTILELESGPLKIDVVALRADRQALSAKAREIARGRDVLFHGTRYRGL